VNDFWLAWGDAVLWVLGFAAVGLIIDQMVFGALKSRASDGRHPTLLQLAMGLHWLPTCLAIIAGARVGITHAPLTLAAFRNATLGIRLLTILVLTAFGARILGRIVRAYTLREDTPLPSGTIFVNLARGIVWVIGGLSLLATAGVSVAPLLTALGVGGLAVGLALQPTLENVFSGIQLLASKQIKPGDFIRLESGEEGTVLDVTWRNTTVQRPSNDIVLVPNSVLARATVTNFTTADPEFVLQIPISFASAGDPDDVERIALEVARNVIAECPEAVPDQEPGARFAELTPPAAVLNVTIRCRSYQERIPVRHEFVRRLAKRFSAEGVEAPPVPLRARATRP
jgi:small-conductance mechanosensitive channel